jgi:hypothetical protein
VPADPSSGAVSGLPDQEDRLSDAVYQTGEGGVVNFLFIATLALILVAAALAGDRWFRPFERAGTAFARKKSLTLVTLGLVTIVARLALLPILPVPAPAIHDEFSYLLSADTFAHGRLTNPPHPFSIFFDTYHELQHPTYASKYPPGPGAVMALGQVLGHPWIGVLLSNAAMVVCMTWMLQGWFSPSWALVGGVLVWAHFGVFLRWPSYYNGSFAMVGAALVFGAYPRVLHFGRARDAFLMAIGAAILAYTRPVEGFIFCLPAAIALSLRLISSRFSDPHLSVPRFFLPMAAALVPAGLFLAYYNFRVTGNALQFPYVLYHREYFNNYPVFVWQKPVPPLHYANQQFENFFNGWNREDFQLSWRAWARRSWRASWELWLLLFGPALTLPLVMLVRVVKDRRMRLPILEILVCSLGLLSVVWFQPNYAAPLAAAVIVVIVQALRHLRRAKIHGSRAIGIFLSRLIVVLALGLVTIRAGRAARYPLDVWKDQRAQVLRTLESVPGNHLVIVRYTPIHNPHREWVYNAADIDASRIVWVREIPGQDITPLLRYYHDRRVWLLEADESPPKLEPYPGTSATLPGNVP